MIACEKGRRSFRFWQIFTFKLQLPAYFREVIGRIWNFAKITPKVSAINWAQKHLKNFISFRDMTLFVERCSKDFWSSVSAAVARLTRHCQGTIGGRRQTGHHYPENIYSFFNLLSLKYILIVFANRILSHSVPSADVPVGHSNALPALLKCEFKWQKIIVRIELI